MTEDPRYPIGRFEGAGRPLTPAERHRHVDAIRRLPGQIREAVEGLSDDQLDTPYRDAGWTVRQLVHHVVDSHMNSYIRFKLAVTEDHPRIMTYDEKLWAELPDGKSGPIEGSLMMLDALHDRWARFLDALEESDFQRTLGHPEIGEITLDFLLELYGWHCAHHVAHVTRLREREGW